MCERAAAGGAARRGWGARAQLAVGGDRTRASAQHFSDSSAAAAGCTVGQASGWAGCEPWACAPLAPSRRRPALGPKLKICRTVPEGCLSRRLGRPVRRHGGGRATRIPASGLCSSEPRGAPPGARQTADRDGRVHPLRLGRAGSSARARTSSRRSSPAPAAARWRLGRPRRARWVRSSASTPAPALAPAAPQIRTAAEGEGTTQPWARSPT